MAATLAAFGFMASRAEADTAPASTDLQILVSSVTFEVGPPEGNKYVVAIINNGPNASNAPITLSTVLPVGLTFSRLGMTGWDCSATQGQSVRCTTAEPLESLGSFVFKLYVGVDDAAVPRVATRLTVAYSADTKASNNSVSRTTSVRQSRLPLPRATSTRPASTPVSTAASTPPVAQHTPTPTATSTPSIAPTVTRTPQISATDLSLRNTVARPFAVNSNGFYVLTVSNLGSASTNAPIAVLDNLPAGLGFVSAVGTGWTCSLTGATVACTNPSPLPAGEATSITLTVSVTRDAYPTVTNVAALSYAADTDVTNNTAVKPTTVRNAPRAPRSPRQSSRRTIR